MLVFGSVVVDAAATDTVTLALTVPLVAVMVSVPVPEPLGQLNVVETEPVLSVVPLVGFRVQPATVWPTMLTARPGSGLPPESKNLNWYAQLLPTVTEEQPLVSWALAGGGGYANATA